MTLFRFGMFMAGVLVSLGNGTVGKNLPRWCIDSVKGKLGLGVIIGGQ